MAAMISRDVTAIVPVKALANAKTRLAPELGSAQRRELMGWMARRVVGACAAARSIAGVVVVAGDDPAAALVRDLADVVIVQSGHGLNAALRAGDAAVATAASLVIAADLPLVRSQDVDAICTHGSEEGTVVVAETLDGGTGAMLRRPARGIDPAYGPGSAVRHRARAEARGLRVRTFSEPGLALDIDTPAALATARARDLELDRWVRDILGA